MKATGFGNGNVRASAFGDNKADKSKEIKEFPKKVEITEKEVGYCESSTQHPVNAKESGEEVKNQPCITGVSNVCSTENLPVNSFKSIVRESAEEDTAITAEKTIVDEGQKESCSKFTQIKLQEEDDYDNTVTYSAEYAQTNQPLTDEKIEHVRSPITRTSGKQQTIRNTPKKESVVKKVKRAMDEFDEDPINGVKRIGSYLIKATNTFLFTRGVKSRRKRGKAVVSKNFDFILADNMLMVIGYHGLEMDVVIPARVGGVSVRYLMSSFLNPDVLSGGMLHSYKIKSIAAAASGKDLESLVNLNIEDILHGVKSIKLPNTLMCIMDGAFRKCYGVKEIVIPASVSYVTHKAFKRSGIERIYFNGEIPKSFDASKFEGEVYVKYEG